MGRWTGNLKCCLPLTWTRQVLVQLRNISLAASHSPACKKVDKSENVCIFHVPVKRLETMQKDANPDKSVLVISIGHVKSLEKLFGEKCTHLGHVLKWHSLRCGNRNLLSSVSSTFFGTGACRAEISMPFSQRPTWQDAASILSFGPDCSSFHPKHGSPVNVNNLRNIDTLSTT